MSRARAARLIAAVALAGLAGQSAPAAGQSDVRTPADPRYKVSLRSNDTGARWNGTVELSFRNDGSAPLARVWLRLWGNGYDGCAPQAVTVKLLTGGKAAPLEQDCTTLPVDLAKPVAPGLRGRLTFTLRITVPPRNDRFGRVRDQVAVGNAIPLLAIEDARGVQLPPYARRGEAWYSQVGLFQVTLDAPARLALPATGVLTASKPAAGKRRVRTYVAQRVRDFAWVAAPLRRYERKTRTGVRLIVWQRASGDPVERDLALLIGQRSLERYAKAFGPYPYPELDVVLMAFTTFGGMEYPALVLANPTDVVVSHEIAHQWWYGLIGNDQWSEPWLDEAFATFASSLVAPSALEGCGTIGWPADDARVGNDMGYWESHGSYGTVIYHNGGCALAALRARLGEDRFWRLMRSYADAHRFGFSTTADFIAAATAAGQAATPPIDVSDIWTTFRITQ